MLSLLHMVDLNMNFNLDRLIDYICCLPDNNPNKDLILGSFLALKSVSISYKKLYFTFKKIEMKINIIKDEVALYLDSHE